MREEKMKLTGIIVGTAAGVYVGIKYILPLLFPFLLAFLCARLIHPAAEKLHRRLRIHKGLLTAALLTSALLIVGAVLWFLGSTVLQQLFYLLENYGFYERQFGAFLKGCCRSLGGMLGVRPAEIENVVVWQVDHLVRNLQVRLVPNLMINSWAYLRAAAETVGVLVVMFVSVILIVNDYSRMRERARHSFGDLEILPICKRILSAVGKFMKAQLIILSVIAAVCTAGLLFMKNPYALLIGALTGFLDALPVLGTGIVLIPMAVMELVRGRALYASVCVGLVILCNLLREFLEPKLIGDRLGVPAIVVLVTAYAGLRLFGITGVITGPLGYLVGREIVKSVSGKCCENS